MQRRTGRWWRSGGASRTATPSWGGRARPRRLQASRRAPSQSGEGCAQRGAGAGMASQAASEAACTCFDLQEHPG